MTKHKLADPPAETYDKASMTKTAPEPQHHKQSHQRQHQSPATQSTTGKIRKLPSAAAPHALTRYTLALLTLIALIALSSTPVQAHESFTRPAPGSGLAALLRGETRIEAVFFDAATTRLIVIDEGSPKRYGNLREALRRHGCHAGINGGYFGADEHSTPLGLIVHQGRRSNRLATGAFTVAGVLSDDGKTIRLERSKALRTPISSMQEAIQGGPFLIERGTPVAGLNNTRRARRSFIATNGRGQWCIAVCSSITLHELAQWLQNGALGNFRVQTALNLDGGSSSALIDTKSGLHIRNIKDVRTYIGLAPRSAPPAP